MESITELIGERIKIYRTKKKLTQAELADAANVHEKHIGSIERGEKAPSIDTIFKICTALELPMEILFKNIIITDNGDLDVSAKFFNIINKLPNKEQSGLYDLIKYILEFHNNNK